MDLFNYRRRESSVNNVGATPMGGDNPIRIQSMTTTSTTDTEASVAQAKRIIEAGGEYVRSPHRVCARLRISRISMPPFVPRV